MWRLFSIPKRWFAGSICLLLYLVAPVPCPAECSLTFLPMEESKYLLKGEGCEGITAINFTVNYDSYDLSSPRVDVMGGKLPEGREAASSPGSLQVHIERENPKDGYLEACVYFQKKEAYPAVINFVTAEVADLSGDLIPVVVEMVEPVPGMNEPDPVEASPDPVVAETEQVTMEPDGKAVFERFRDFAGEKNFGAFTALFSGTDSCCRQTPPVAISDGRQTVQVVIGGVEEGRLMQMKDRAPLFTVSGGQLISVKRGTEEEWIAIIRPNEKWWDVRVSCTAADETINFPLTVAPPIHISPDKLAEINEKTFMPRLRSFLDTSGKEKQQVALWFHEYLFTANYLAAQEELKRKMEGSQPSRQPGHRQKYQWERR